MMHGNPNIKVLSEVEPLTWQLLKV